MVLGRYLFNFKIYFRGNIYRLLSFAFLHRRKFIEKESFDKKFNFEEYGVNLINEDGRLTVDTLKWNGIAKKSGLDIGDIINEFKIENQNRPKKEIIYPIALILLSIFGYLNIRRRI